MDFYIMDFSGNQMIQGPIDSFLKLKTMNKGLIKQNDRSFKKK